MIERYKTARNALGRRFGGPGRERLKRVGGYAALALLLVILGLASHAYRERAEEPSPQAPVVKTALSARAEAALPTPEPTAEPVVWVWPLEGEIVGAWEPNAPTWSDALSLWQTHPALDIAGSPGEAVYACRDGVVADKWWDRLWGNVIVLEHDDGYRSTCAGLNTLKLVEVGDAVRAGDVISAVAPTLPCEPGLPAHIHFALTKDGAEVDFEELVRERGADPK